MGFSEWRFFVLFFSLLCSVCSVDAKTSAWREYRSDHFTLYSDRKRSESVALLQQFERFRYAALSITGLNTQQVDEPVNVFMFRQPEDYSAVQPDEQVAGYYRDSWQGPEMVVGAESSLRDVSLILFHEYVHYLVRARSQIRYPLWYDEGFADLMAASLVTEDHVVIGLVHPWRKSILDDKGVLSVTRILQSALEKNKFNVNGEEQDAAFYASAWLLMHYLQLGHLSGAPDYGSAITRYLTAIQNGIDSQTAFSQSFAVGVEDLQAQFDAYSQRKHWKGYRLAVPVYGKHIDQRSLDANEAAYILGNLAYRSGQPEAALEFLQRVDANSTSVAPAFSLRAVIEGHRRRPDLALHILGFALKQDKNNSCVLSNAAHLHWDLAKNKQFSLEQRQQHLDAAERFAKKALEQDPFNVEATRFLARVYRDKHNNEQAITLLLDIYATRPSDVRLNLELGSFYAEAGQLEKAVPYLEKVVQWDHSNERRKKALALLQPITDLKSALSQDLDEETAAPIRIAPKP